MMIIKKDCNYLTKYQSKATVAVAASSYYATDVAFKKMADKLIKILNVC